MPNNIQLYVEKYSWTLNVLLIVLLALSAAKTTNAFVRNAYTPPPKVEAWMPPLDTDADQRADFPISLAKIEERNIFGAKIRSEVVADAQTPTDVNYNFCIQGLVAGGKWNLATMLNKDTQKVIVVAPGDEVGPGATVREILPDKVVIVYTGGRDVEIPIEYGEDRCKGGAAPPRVMPGPPTREGAYPPPGMPAQPVTPGTGTEIQMISETEFVIDKAYFEAQMADMNTLITQARLVPNFTPDRQVDGFRIFQIVPNSVFQKLGLRNGDVIAKVNGLDMNDPARGLELFQMLKNESRFTIDLKRHNNPTTMNYSVK